MNFLYFLLAIIIINNLVIYKECLTEVEIPADATDHQKNVIKANNLEAKVNELINNDNTIIKERIIQSMAEETENRKKWRNAACGAEYMGEVFCDEKDEGDEELAESGEKDAQRDADNAEANVRNKYGG